MNRPDDLENLNLVDLSRYIFSNIRILGLSSLIAIISGLFIAFGLPIEYESYSKILPEKEESGQANLGGLGGLAGLAGINLDMNSNNFLNPTLFPEIVSSTPFQLDIIHTKIKFDRIDTVVSPYFYFKELRRDTYLQVFYRYTFGLPNVIISSFKGENSISEGLEKITGRNTIEVSKSEWEIIEAMSERIEITSDAKTGIIVVQCIMPDPVASAELTSIVIERLKEEISNYKVAKAEERLKFLKERYHEVSKEYNNIQYDIAKFTDKNRYTDQAIYLLQLDRLKQEANVSYEVYKSIATQLEQAKINLKEQTPMFTMIEPVKVPVSKDSPRRGLILAVFLFIGILSSLVYLTFKFVLK